MVGGGSDNDLTNHSFIGKGTRYLFPEVSSVYDLSKIALDGGQHMLTRKQNKLSYVRRATFQKYGEQQSQRNFIHDYGTG